MTKDRTFDNFKKQTVTHMKIVRSILGLQTKKFSKRQNVKPCLYCKLSLMKLLKYYVTNGHINDFNDVQVPDVRRECPSVPGQIGHLSGSTVYGEQFLFKI